VEGDRVNLVLPGRVLADIHAEAARAYPEEGCGVMLGVERDDRREVVRVIALPNRREDSRSNRYVIDPEQFLAAEHSARDAGMDVVGFFHSHPDHPARPSTFDLEHAWPWSSYVIVSVHEGIPAETTSWRLAEDRTGFGSERIVTDSTTAPVPED
jgi:proteasome lid subunit RPN8/RPN11